MGTHSIIFSWRIPWTRGAWRATVRGVTESRIRLRDSHTHTHTHMLYSVVLVSAVQRSESALYTHISPPSWASLPPLSVPQSTEQSSLYFIADPHQPCSSHMVGYTCQSQSPIHPMSLPLLCSCIHSLLLCLYSCPANRFICTIFLDSAYMH